MPSVSAMSIKVYIITKKLVGVYDTFYQTNQLQNYIKHVTRSISSFTNILTPLPPHSIRAILPTTARSHTVMSMSYFATYIILNKVFNK